MTQSDLHRIILTECSDRTVRKTGLFGLPCDKILYLNTQSVIYKKNIPVRIPVCPAVCLSIRLKKFFSSPASLEVSQVNPKIAASNERYYSQVTRHKGVGVLKNRRKG